MICFYGAHLIQVKFSFIIKFICNLYWSHFKPSKIVSFIDCYPNWSDFDNTIGINISFHISLERIQKGKYFIHQRLLDPFEWSTSIWWFYVRSSILTLWKLYEIHWIIEFSFAHKSNSYWFIDFKIEFRSDYGIR